MLGGVTIDSGGNLANGGAISAVGDAVTGIGGTLANQSGGVIAGLNAVHFHTLPGAVTNGGAIGGGTTGIVLEAGGAVLNLAGGVISGGVGVQVGPAAGVVNNFGTITGTGGIAVQFGAADGDRLVVHRGAAFTGIVAGGDGADTLDLASGIGIGTIGGVGSNFIGFETLALQGGAQWRMAGQNTLPDHADLAIGLGAMLTVAGTLRAAGTVELTRLGRLAVRPNGAIVIGDGPATDGAITVGVGARLSGIGSLRGDIIDKGLITATGGGLRVIGDVAGSGTMAIDANAVLAVSGALASRFVTFLPAGGAGGGTLQLGAPAAVTSIIRGFGATDTIDLLGIGLASSISFAGQILTVTPAVGASFALNFAGAHNPALFAIAPDGNGGTLLTYG